MDQYNFSVKLGKKDKQEVAIRLAEKHARWNALNGIVVMDKPDKVNDDGNNDENDDDDGNDGAQRTVAHEVKRILHYIRENSIRYPLSRLRYSAEDIRLMYKNLREYRPLWRTNVGSSSQMKLVCSQHDWWHIDIAIDYFTEYERIQNRKSYSEPSVSAWEDDQSLATLIEQQIVKYDVREFTMNNFCRALYGDKTVAGLTLFRPTRAKALIQYILCRTTTNERLSDLEDMNYLDMCSGWGCRLFAAASCHMNYFGCDTNSQLFAGYKQMLEFFSDMPGKQEIHNKPFEDSRTELQVFTKQHGLFDICMTSPPFFTLELYNGPQTSTTRYPEFTEWLHEFLFKSIALSWEFIAEEGFLVIHMDDIMDFNVITPLKDYVRTHLQNSMSHPTLLFCGRHTEHVRPATVFVWQKKKKVNSIKRRKNDDIEDEWV